MNLIDFCTLGIIDTLRRKEDVASLFDKILTLARKLLAVFPEFYLLGNSRYSTRISVWSGNWEKHLSSFQKCTHTSLHLTTRTILAGEQYVCWTCTNFLMKLQKFMTNLREEILLWNVWTETFNQLSVHQALGHINKESKRFRRNSGIGMKVDEFHASLDLSNHSSQNVEGGKKLMSFCDVMYFPKTKIVFL